MPWIITRPADEADRDVAVLRAHGLDATAIPLLERAMLPWTAERPDLVLLSSASVIPAVLDHWARWSPQPRVAAMLPETAARARQSGLPVDVAAPGGAVALAEAVLDAWARLGRPARALYPTSQAGLDSPEQARAIARLETCLLVDRVAVLELRTPIDLDDRVGRAPAGARWVIASPSAARVLFQTHEVPRPSMLLCHGASTCDVALSMLPPGWPSPLRATAGTVVEAVLEIERLDPLLSLEGP